MKQAVTLFRNVTIPGPSSNPHDHRWDIMVIDGRIASIAPPRAIGSFQGLRVIEMPNGLLLPAAVDPHVHARDSEEAAKEDFTSVSRAALANGVGTIIVMPNTRPPITTLAALDAYRRLAEKAKVRVRYLFGVTPKNAKEIARAAKEEDVAGFKMYMGSSTGNLLVADIADQRRLAAAIAETGKPLCVHAEDEEVIRARAAMETGSDVRAHGRIRGPAVELRAVRKMLEITRLASVRVHFCHVSTAGAARQIKEYRDAYDPTQISVEATPHHLLFDQFSLRGNRGKVNPPLRSQGDREALLRLIDRDAYVDCLASDHAPHLPAEKDLPYADAPAGLPGVGMTLRFALDYFRGDWARVMHLTHLGPSRIFGLPEPMFFFAKPIADLVLVDLDAVTTLTAERLGSKCGWSPYEGMRMRGEIVLTMIGGEIRYDGLTKTA